MGTGDVTGFLDVTFSGLRGVSLPRSYIMISDLKNNNGKFCSEGAITLACAQHLFELCMHLGLFFMIETPSMHLKQGAARSSIPNLYVFVRE